MGRLTGKTALITGCNRGIGKAILQSYLKEGASVIACTRNVTDDLKSEYGKIGGTIIPVKLDLTDEESIKAGMKSVLDLKMPIDILINNAGIARFKPFMMSKVEDFKQIMQVNLYAPAQITQYVVKNMLKQKRGSIINLSSISGLDANAGNAAYGASKAALEALTRSIALEVGKYGFTVNCVAPGPTQTGWIDEELEKTVIPLIPMKKLILPQDIAETILFLASEQAKMITGQVIKVSGGHAI